MTLKVYADRLSQPSRAILIFCKVNGIDVEEVKVEISKREHLAPAYQEINPMKQVPAIDDGKVKLFESHAILSYLACANPGVPDHWYPSDLVQRAKVQSVLDWHHSNLRRGSVGYIMNTILAPLLGLPSSPQAAAEGEKLLCRSLEKLETIWLQESGPFLLGNDKPSVADLSLVCEIIQLQFLDEKDRTRFLAPHKKVQQWIEHTKNATNPYFDEVHQTLFQVSEIMKKQRAAAAASGASGN